MGRQSGEVEDEPGRDPTCEDLLEAAVDVLQPAGLGVLVPTGVDDVVRAQVLGQLELVVLDVDRDGAGAEDPRVLQGQVAEAPPMPTTIAVSAGWGWATVSALYVVTPAHVRGAASREETAEGTLTTWLA